MIETCTLSDSESDYEGDSEEATSEGEHVEVVTPVRKTGKGKGKDGKPEKTPRKKKPMPLKKKAEMEMSSGEEELDSRDPKVSHRDHTSISLLTQCCAIFVPFVVSASRTRNKHSSKFPIPLNL